MQINKQDEKLLQELLKKYKQGIISGFYSGNNITFTPTGCRDKIISSTSSGIGGGIQSIQEGDNITVDNTDPLNPIISAIGGSSELFPNGLSEETVSRQLTSDDIGKLLIIVNDGVILTPADDMAATGDLPKGFGIWCLNPTTKTSGFKVNTSSEITYLETAGSVFGGGQIVSFMTLYDDDLETTNIFPLSDIMLPDDFTGTVGQLAIPYLLGQSQNVILLSGTVSGSPVTGDIEFEANTYKGLKTLNANGDAYNSVQMGDGGVIISSKSTPTTETKVEVIDAYGKCSLTTDNPNPIGYSCSVDCTPYIGDLDYTQKIYVGFRGTATLSSGTVTVATDKIKTGYKIYVSVNTPSGTQGFLSAPTGSIVDATSFVINSTNAGDNSTVNWWIAP